MLNSSSHVGCRNCITLVTKRHGLKFRVTELDQLAAIGFELDLFSSTGGSSPDFTSEVAQMLEASVMSHCSIGGGYQTFRRLFERHP